MGINEAIKFFDTAVGVLNSILLLSVFIITIYLIKRREKIDEKYRKWLPVLIISMWVCFIAFVLTK